MGDASPEPQMKICPKCNLANRAEGQSYCKPCQAEYAKERRRARKQTFIQEGEESLQICPKCRSRRSRPSHAYCRECYAAYMKARRTTLKGS